MMTLHNGDAAHVDRDIGFTNQDSLDGIHGCHLIGSVPLSDTEAVFRRCNALLPARLKRIPDGETGDRQLFTTFQAHLFAVYPPMMTQFEHNAPINSTEFTPEQIQEGVNILKSIDLHTGYDDVAIESYGTFRRMRDEGVIPHGVKFQVCLPGIANVINPFVQKAFQAIVEPFYEKALARAVRRIQDKIPHEDLAIQIDVAADTAFWEATNTSAIQANDGLLWYQPWWEGDVKQYQTDYLVRAISQVDDDVEVGLHNCYGDMQHKHFHEPSSLSVVVERALWIYSASPRKINFFHCPVPKSAEDHIDAYLEPLKYLLPVLRQHDTDLYLGVVHEHHPDLTKKYVKAAKKVVPTFGVSAECGGGRMEWKDFEDMLNISREVSLPLPVVDDDAMVGAEQEPSK